jgi:exopolysaccharide biosynthesis polyprenyl glycosylphosphotransferase
MYRGNGLRLVPSGLPIFTSVARSTPLAMLAMIGIFLASGWHLELSWVFAGTALLMLPALLTVPALRSGVAVGCGKFSASAQQRVLIVGAGEVADHVVKRLHRHGMITPIGMVDDDPLPGFDTIGTLADVPRLCREERVDRIIVALPRAPWLDVSETLHPLITNVDIAVVPSLYELMTWRSGMDDLAGMPLIPLIPAQKNAPTAWIKRGIDIILGFLVLIVTSPILLVTACAIKLTSRGPVFFRQRRAGLNGTSFSIWKFRTMYVDAEARQPELLSEADGPRFKMASDPRVTKVGMLLRRFSIDELPQLFNVLAGTMSLVGPRPFPIPEAESFYTGSTIARFQMRPGMTGLWQVSGRSDLSWDDLCRLDTIYVGSWSLMWDLRILLQTPVAVLRRRGAY